MPAHIRCCRGGFTLLELLYAVAVIAVLLVLTSTGFSSLIRDNRRAALLNEFVAALQYARLESIVRGKEVAICKSSNGSSCSNTSASWDAGWIVFVNSDEDDPPKVDGGDEPVLRVHGAVAAPAHITANRSYFRFHALDMHALNGTVTFCDDRGSTAASAVIVSIMGRTRVAHSKPDGSPLDCP